MSATVATAVRLSELLIAAGVEPAAVAAARAEAEARNVSLSTIALKRGLIDATRLAALVSSALGLTIHHLDEGVALPESMSRRLRALTLGVVTVAGERRQLVGMTDPTDVIARLEIIRAVGGAIQCVVIEDDALERALGEVTAADQPRSGQVAVTGTMPTASAESPSHAELFARIANTHVQDRSVWGLVSTQGETQPTVRTRLLRALANHMELMATPIAVLSELRLLIIATEDAARERVTRELAGIPRLRLAMTAEAAIEAAGRSTFDAAVLVGSLDEVMEQRSALADLGEQTCLVVVATTALDPTVVDPTASAASALRRDLGLPRAVLEALVAATGTPAKP